MSSLETCEKERLAHLHAASHHFLPLLGAGVGKTSMLQRVLEGMDIKAQLPPPQGMTTKPRYVTFTIDTAKDAVELTTIDTVSLKPGRVSRPRSLPPSLTFVVDLGACMQPGQLEDFGKMGSVSFKTSFHLILAVFAINRCVPVPLSSRMSPLMSVQCGGVATLLMSCSSRHTGCCSHDIISNSVCSRLPVRLVVSASWCSCLSKASLNFLPTYINAIRARIPNEPAMMLLGLKSDLARYVAASGLQVLHCTC